MVFLELMGELESWALPVAVVQVALLESEAPVEMLVALESLVSWDPEVFLAPLEMLAQLVKKALRVSLVSTAGLAQLAQLVQEEKLVTSDSLDPKAPLVILAKVVIKDILVLLVLGVPLVLMETTVLRDLLDPRVSKVVKVNRVLLVLQVSRVCLALQVQLEKLANQEKGVPLVNLVSLVLLVQEGNGVHQAKVALWVPLVLLEAEVLLDPQDLTETRVNPVWLVLLVTLVHLVLVASQEREVLPVYLEAKEKRVKPVTEVNPETLAGTVLVVLPVL